MAEATPLPFTSLIYAYVCMLRKLRPIYICINFWHPAKRNTVYKNEYICLYLPTYLYIKVGIAKFFFFIICSFFFYYFTLPLCFVLYASMRYVTQIGKQHKKWKHWLHHRNNIYQQDWYHHHTPHTFLNCTSLLQVFFYRIDTDYYLLALHNGHTYTQTHHKYGI